MYKIFSLAITFLFLAFGLALGVLNPSVVNFDMFLLQMELPLSVLMALAIMAGMLISAFYFTSQLFHQKWLYKKLSKENQKLSDEVVQLNKKIVDVQAEASGHSANAVSTTIEPPKELASSH